MSEPQAQAEHRQQGSTTEDGSANESSIAHRLV